MRIFADTSGLFAFKYKKDENHPSARMFLERITNREIPMQKIYLSDYIFDELITLLKAVVPNVDDVIAFGEALKQSGGFHILAVDEKISTDAWAIFKKYKNMRGLSFTDCTSVALVNSLDIDAIFAYDEHFLRMGIKTVG